MIKAALDIPPQVAIGDYPDKVSGIVDHADYAQALGGHFHDRVMD